MIFNHLLKSSLRNIWRNRYYSILNISGLAVGIAIFFGILSIYLHEESYNDGLTGNDRVYRVYSSYGGSNPRSQGAISYPIAEYIIANFGNEQSFALLNTWSARVTIPQEKLPPKRLGEENALVFTNPGLFDVIDVWEWEAGSVEGMKDVNAVTLLRSQAEKYFGEMPAASYLGREVIYFDSLSMNVVGIVSDPSSNTDFKFTDFLSSATVKSSPMLQNNFMLEDWGTLSSNLLFIKLHDNNNLPGLRAVLDRAVEKLNNVYKEEFNTADANRDFKLQPLSDIHFNEELNSFYGFSYVADREILFQLLIVGIAILLLGVVNFINLETAIGIRRGHEIAMRKIMGSSRSAVTGQLLLQNLILAFIAGIIAMPLLSLGFHFLNDVVPQTFVFDPLDGSSLILLAIIIAVTGFLSGIYPAILMSSFKASAALKKQVLSNSRNKSISGPLRKGMTVFQFSISQTLLILTFIVFYQIDYIVNKDVGFDSEGIVYLWTPYNAPKTKTETFYNELARLEGVDAITMYERLPRANGNWNSTISFTGEGGEELNIKASIKVGDSNYVDFFGIELVEGRKIVSENEVYINEKLSKELGFANPSDALGKTVKRGGTFTIAGVMKDFHSQSLHHDIEPIMFQYSDSSPGIAVKGSKELSIQDISNKVRATYDNVYPDYPIEVMIYEDFMNDFYKEEQRISVLITTAAAIAIFISCLGLLGLSSFISLQRTKEIAIRKVQGALTMQIVKLLTKDFLKLVVIACLLAIPIALYIGDMWLQEYAFKIEINAWIFIYTTGIIACIAMGTVGYHSLMAASNNPVKSLKSE